MAFCLVPSNQEKEGAVSVTFCTFWSQTTPIYLLISQQTTCLTHCFWAFNSENFVNISVSTVQDESIKTNNKCLSNDFVKLIRFQFEKIDFLITKIYLATKGPPSLWWFSINRVFGGSECTLMSVAGISEDLCGFYFENYCLVTVLRILPR